MEETSWDRNAVRLGETWFKFIGYSTATSALFSFTQKPNGSWLWLLAIASATILTFWVWAKIKVAAWEIVSPTKVPEGASRITPGAGGLIVNKKTEDKKIEPKKEESNGYFVVVMGLLIFVTAASAWTTHLIIKLIAL